MVSTQLVITLAGHGLSALCLLLAGLAVFTRDTKKPLYRYYAFLAFSILAFEIGFIAAPLMPTYELAYKVWFLNIVNILPPIAASLFVFQLTGSMKAHRWYLRGIIFIALSILSAALVYPTLFLPQVSPKLYFPWYLDAGPLYVIMLFYFFGALIYAFIHLLRAYLKTRRKDYEYFVVMFLIAYAIGPLNFFLVFDFPVDPIYGFATGLSVLPLAYGILTDELLDIRVIAKRALLYSAGIGATVFTIALLIFLNNQIVELVPWVQFWTIPLIAGVGAFVIGHLFWRKSVESDRLKYEFVTVVTHKLRTPLTQISWGIKALREEGVKEQAEKIVDRIDHANARLIELTNIIFESAEEKSSGYTYTREDVDIENITRETIDTFTALAEQKEIQIDLKTEGVVHAPGDTRRLRSVIEVLVENAIAYSPQGSTITITLSAVHNRVRFVITDQGFGVAPDEKARIFTRFYRSDAAKRADTEGVGLGLAMAKNIIKAHKGRIGVESEGEGKGSTFWFWIPTK